MRSLILEGAAVVIVLRNVRPPFKEPDYMKGVNTQGVQSRD